MTASRDLDAKVTDWLHARATADGSDDVLAAALSQASKVSQDARRSTRPAAYLRQWTRPAILVAPLGIAAVLVAVTAMPPMPKSASATVTGVWPSGADVAFTAMVTPGGQMGVYWRGPSFDTWSPGAKGWSTHDETAVPVDAGALILDGADEPMPSNGVSETTAIIVPTRADPILVAPGVPLTVDQPTEVATAGQNGALVRVSLSRPAASYRVSAAHVAVASAAASDGVSPSQLRSAGTDYPEDVRTRFATPPPTGELGAESLAFLRSILSRAGDNPYETASMIVDAFHDPMFTYVVDTRGIECGSDGFTECFLRTKRGYCMYFATAMIMLLREEGIPARMVMGYLPGEQAGSVITVRTHDAHSWVEVFFPGQGWVPFDPTPRPRPQAAPVAPNDG